MNDIMKLVIVYYLGIGIVCATIMTVVWAMMRHNEKEEYPLKYLWIIIIVVTIAWPVFIIASIIVNYCPKKDTQDKILNDSNNQTNDIEFTTPYDSKELTQRISTLENKECEKYIHVLNELRNTVNDITYNNANDILNGTVELPVSVYPAPIQRFNNTIGSALFIKYRRDNLISNDWIEVIIRIEDNDVVVTTQGSVFNYISHRYYTMNTNGKNNLTIPDINILLKDTFDMMYNAVK